MSERYDVNLNDWSDGAGRAHLARYFLARGYLQSSDRVVDAACGYGYGSKLLSSVCSQITGIDNNQGVIDRARQKYSNINFLCADLNSCKIPDCDVLVSLETIEHLQYFATFLKEARLKTHRLIIFSVPMETVEDRLGNEFHLHSFDESISQLVAQDGWQMFHSYLQGNHFIGVAWKPKQ